MLEKDCQNNIKIAVKHKLSYTKFKYMYLSLFFNIHVILHIEIWI